MGDQLKKEENRARGGGEGGWLVMRLENGTLSVSILIHMVQFPRTPPPFAPPQPSPGICATALSRPAIVDILYLLSSSCQLGQTLGTNVDGSILYLTMHIPETDRRKERRERGGSRAIKTTVLTNGLDAELICKAHPP